jgi:soluble lytic murein transglycosylase
MERAGDATATLNVAKIASQRGFALDEHAFPTFGIPPYEPFVRFAEKPMVYAIARQESAFMPKVISHAGAKGLMQMMTATAKLTAQKAGVPFDEGRLTSDPAYNAALGSAHLADLLANYRGSNIMTFAAYNAGPRRVREWVAAAGDPRDPNVDPIDWIERIPIAETRNYVQRIVENLEVYRVRMGESRTIAIDKTLRQAER